MAASGSYSANMFRSSSSVSSPRGQTSRGANTQPASYVKIPFQVQMDILDYLKKTTEFMMSCYDWRSRLTQIDLEYYRENLLTKESMQEKAALRAGNKRIIADMVVPIVEPQIETSLAYLTSVFCTGIPMFGVVSEPTNFNEAKALEGIIDKQARYGAWIRHFMISFRHGLKYNFMGMELDWCQEKTYQPYSVAGSENVSVEQRQVIWKGNKVRSIDPYNAIFDPRVVPAEMHSKGEFGGYVEIMSHVALKEYIQNLNDKMNLKAAFEAPEDAYTKYFIPDINWNDLSKKAINSDINWSAWAMGKENKNKIQYKNTYTVVTRYCRIIPELFGLEVPSSKTTQIWKFITINDSVLLSAQKMTNAHNSLPTLFAQPIEDGLGYQTKSQAERLIPLQDSASAMWNARMASQRRNVSDRAIYNPAMIREEDVNNPNPSAKIPVRNFLYNKTLDDAYKSIPYEDRTSGSFVGDAREMMQFANFVSGQNQAQQGQFVKGNKTLHEYENVMGNSSGRQQMQAWFIEAQFMTPFKQIMVSNILQYESAGNVMNYGDEKSYVVDPMKMRAATLSFKISDGLVPKDKYMEPEVLSSAFQLIATSPALQAQYDVGGIFNYMISDRGFDLSPFKIQQKPAGSPNPVPPQVPPTTPPSTPTQ